MDINERFEKAIDSLYADKHNLATEVTKLGYPILSKSVPTAGVSWDKDMKKIRFEFNKDFAEKLDDKEFLFVIAHETIHILNCHIYMIAEKFHEYKNKYKNEEKRKNEELSKFLRKFNVAADCVVNDSLVNLYGFEKTLEEIAIYGKKILNIDCHNLSVWEVFSLLPETKTMQFDVHFWESFFDKDGNVNKDFTKKIKGIVEKGLDNSALSDEEAELIEKAAEALKKNAQQQGGLQAGTEAIGRARPIVNISRNTISWEKLLKDLSESKKIEDDWNRPNRKLFAFYPKVILPKYKQQETKELFVAIDASGSINTQVLDLFVSVIRNTPKIFNIKAISFDTQCYDFNIRSNDSPRGGGGTSFSIIEDYIQANFKRYPDVIFVLTDGYGDYVNPKHPNRWAFLLYGSSSSEHCKKMKHYKMEKLLKHSI